MVVTSEASRAPLSVVTAAPATPRFPSTEMPQRATASSTSMVLALVGTAEVAVEVSALRGLGCVTLVTPSTILCSLSTEA